ncbi:aryl-sulfate sulfotransferase [Hymenobacter terricola]|uniref:aryl-sulfate sulfotransferase n=1 Tax=Hymenobacter terricola TaxID=2819236 RepID=UPI001B307069|nr:aryl-sulfate sulfotransferase [Hymenobacter terricola]
MLKHLSLLSIGIFMTCLSSCRKDDVVVPVPTVQSSPIPRSTLLLNPSGYAPLSAQLTFSTTGAGTTTVVVHGKHGPASDITQHIHDAGPTHVAPILGLYANWANFVTVTFTADNGQTVLTDTLTVRTGFLPANLPTAITVTTPPAAALGGALSLVSNFSRTDPYVPFVVDNYGDIRWLLDFSTHPTLNHLAYDCGISRLKNGDYFFGDKTTGKLYEVDAFGKSVATWDLPGYTFHHEAYEKPDGNFLVTVSKDGSTNLSGGPTVEDFVIELNRTTGAVVHEWDLRALLDEGRTALESDPQDWLHINAVMYDPADNTVVISGRFQGVVKVSYSDQIVWILAPHKGWGTNRRGQDLNNYLLTPLDANGALITDTDVLLGNTNRPDFEWNWYQHSPTKMPNGDWMLFDNGTHRNFGLTNAVYSRAVEYRIDPVHMTVQQVWEYGKERGADTFSSIVSRVQFLPGTNHVLFCPGYQVPTASGQGGRIIEVDYTSRQTLFEMSLTVANGFGFHRADRTTLGQ